MTLTVSGIEISIGSLFHKFASVAANVATALGKLTTDVDKIAPVVEEVTALIPGGAGASAAEQAVVAIINAVDAAVTAAEGQASGGVTVSLPAELVATYTSAKTTILAAAKAL